MKRFWFFVITGILILSLAACSSQGSKETGEGPKDEPTTDESNTEEEQETSQEQDAFNEEDAEGAGEGGFFEEYSEEDLSNMSIAFISAFQENPVMEEILQSYPNAERFSYAPEGYEAMNDGVLVSINDNTRVEMLNVDGFDDETSSLILGESVFERVLNRGEALILRYFENETIPPTILRITNDNTGEQTLFDLGYDGSGMSTDENEITRQIQFYDKADNVFDYDETAAFVEKLYQFTKEN